MTTVFRLGGHEEDQDLSLFEVDFEIDQGSGEYVLERGRLFYATDIDEALTLVRTQYAKHLASRWKIKAIRERDVSMVYISKSARIYPS